MIPRNWPKDFTYAATSIILDIHPHLFAHMVASPIPEHQTLISSCIEQKKVHPSLIIQQLVPPHPLSKPNPLIKRPVQYGVFASHKIRQGEDLGEYVGEITLGIDEIIPPQGVYTWGATFNGYLFNICSERVANELTFVNDYRGIQDKPNVGAKWLIHLGICYFGYVALKDIEPNEELLIDYGANWAKTYASITNRQSV